MHETRGVPGEHRHRRRDRRPAARRGARRGDRGRTRRRPEPDRARGPVRGPRPGLARSRRAGPDPRAGVRPEALQARPRPPRDGRRRGGPPRRPAVLKPTGRTTMRQDTSTTEAVIVDALPGFGVEAGQIALDTPLADLDIDSLDLAELSQIVSDRFGVEIGADDVPRLTT